MGGADRKTGRGQVLADRHTERQEAFFLPSPTSPPPPLLPPPPPKRFGVDVQETPNGSICQARPFHCVREVGLWDASVGDPLGLSG